MAHENVYFSNGNHERRNSKFADEMRNVELYFKEDTIVYGFYPLEARLLKNAMTLINGLID